MAISDYERLINEDFSNYARLQEDRPGEKGRRENHPFFFPGNRPPHINTSTGGPKDVFKDHGRLRRGFMRSIIFGEASAGKTVVDSASQGNIRLNFQFNPEYIERNVAQSQGAVNPLLQNPANLTQPVPGTASFNFTMTFNREYEVNLRDKNINFGATVGETAGSMDFLTNDLSSQLENPMYSGVLHDLAIFDKIIGQGISQEIVETLTNYNKKVAEVQQSLSQDTENQQFLPTEFKPDVFTQSLNRNFGNSAFINPLPVRIVFGDLFMVEGFVVGSAVAFQKFNKDMIPTICQVNCQVQALYFGFAKRKAFLTDSLSDWYTTTIDTESQQTKEKEESKILAEKYLKDILGFCMVWNTSGQDYANKSYTDDFYNLDMPQKDSDYQKVLGPTNTWKSGGSNLYYEGNGNTTEERFITLPQWYNTFSKYKYTTPVFVDGSSKRTYPAMLDEDVLKGQNENFNSNWQKESQLDSDRKLQGYTPISVEFKIRHPLVTPGGQAREASFPNDDFTSIFNLELSRISITPSGNAAFVGSYDLEILNIVSQDVAHWSLWYRYWIKHFTGSSWRSFPNDNLFKCPGMRKNWWGTLDKTKESIFCKIYWVRPAFSDTQFLPDASSPGTIFQYELAYHFTMTINNQTYQLNPIVASYRSNEPFLAHDDTVMKAKARWANPRLTIK